MLYTTTEEGLVPFTFKDFLKEVEHAQVTKHIENLQPAMLELSGVLNVSAEGPLITTIRHYLLDNIRRTEATLNMENMMSGLPDNRRVLYEQLYDLKAAECNKENNNG